MAQSRSKLGLKRWARHWLELGRWPSPGNRPTAATPRHPRRSRQVPARTPGQDRCRAHHLKPPTGRLPQLSGTQSNSSVRGRMADQRSRRSGHHDLDQKFHASGGPTPGQATAGHQCGGDAGRWMFRAFGDSLSVVGWFWLDGRRRLVLLPAGVGGIVLIRWVRRSRRGSKGLFDLIQ